jgi:hypothetical protein
MLQYFFYYGSQILLNDLQCLPLLITSSWRVQFLYSQTHLQWHQFMRHLVNSRYSGVTVNSTLLTISLHCLVRTTLMYNHTKYSLPFMTLLYLLKCKVRFFPLNLALLLNPYMTCRARLHHTGPCGAKPRRASPNRHMRFLAHWDIT